MKATGIGMTRTTTATLKTTVKKKEMKEQTVTREDVRVMTEMRTGTEVKDMLVSVASCLCPAF